VDSLTPFGFLALLPLRPPRQLLSPRHRLPPPGTVASVILVEMFWLRLVVVEMSLVLGLLLSTSVRHASLVIMFGFLFLLLRMLLILSTVICGLLLYSAFLAISIIW
jgi:hypothetical protein